MGDRCRKCDSYDFPCKCVTDKKYFVISQDDHRTACNYMRQAQEYLLENKPIQAHNHLKKATQYIDKVELKRE